MKTEEAPQKMERLRELESILEPIMKWMQDNAHLNCLLVISRDRFDFYEALCGSGVPPITKVVKKKELYSILGTNRKTLEREVLISNLTKEEADKVDKGKYSKDYKHILARKNMG